MDTCILINFDADTSCNDCCRPITGIASFVGFNNDQEIVEFIVNDPECKGMYKTILWGMAWF